MRHNQSINQGISDDNIDNILSGIKDWIGIVDTKISFLLTVACIFLGYIIENDIAIYGKLESCFSYWWIFLLLTVSLVLSIISIMLFISALKATNKHSLNYKSVIFAGDIASNNSFEDYDKKLSKIVKKDLQDDKKKQIYITANIYDQKVKTYNRGLWITIATMVVYVIYKILFVETGL